MIKLVILFATTFAASVSTQSVAPTVAAAPPASAATTAPPTTAMRLGGTAEDGKQENHLHLWNSLAMVVGVS